MKRLDLGSHIARFGYDGKLRAALCLMALLGIAALPRLYESFSHDLIYRRDIMQEYLLARATFARVNPYQTLPELAYKFIGVRDSQILPHPTPHPPSIIPLVLWMGWLDYESCALIWFALELLFLAMFGYLAARRLHLTPYLGWGTVVAVSMVAWYPVFLDLVYGQLMLLLSVLLFGAMELLQHDKPVAGGVLIGLAVAAKLFVWPMWVLMAMRRQWRTLIASVLCFVCLTAIGALMIGFDDAAHYYLDISRDVSKLYRACTVNYSLSTIGWRLFDGARCETIISIVADPVVRNKGLAEVVAWALPCAVLVLSVSSCRKTSSYEAQYCLMVSTCVLVSPIAWMHYLSLTAIPLVISLARLHGESDARQSRLRLCLVAAMALTFLPERIILTFVGRFGTNANGLRAGEVAVPFSVGLITLLPLGISAALMWLHWLISRHDTGCSASVEGSHNATDEGNITPLVQDHI